MDQHQKSKIVKQDELRKKLLAVEQQFYFVESILDVFSALACGQSLEELTSHHPDSVGTLLCETKNKFDDIKGLLE